ncbi:hypothetical protein H6758_03290 [Candidatus Nomurabacteria bacterium]|nr:hypothetical protein [Candidatus Nomurabacteria bacterium]
MAEEGQMKPTVLLLVFLGLSPAQAMGTCTSVPNEQKAECLYKQGEGFFKQGRFFDAKASFEEAIKHEKSDKAATLFYNVGRATEEAYNVGQGVVLSQVIEAWEKYVQRYPGDTHVTAIKMKITALKAKEKAALDEANKPSPKGFTTIPKSIDVIEPTTSRKQLIGWSLMGLGAAAAVAIVGPEVSKARAEDKREGCKTFSCQDDQEDFADSMRTTSLVLSGVAAAAIGTGLYFLLTDNDSSATTYITPTTQGAAIVGSF